MACPGAQFSMRDGPIDGDVAQRGLFWAVPGGLRL